MEYLKDQNLIPKCRCGKNVTYKKYKGKGAVFRETCGSHECWLKAQRTPEKINIIRQKRFDYLKTTNNETPWERKRNGKMSYLENWFFEKCQEYKLQEQYDIITEYPVYPHFIDYAFINLNLAVELDGQQHFTRKKQQEKDKEKEDNLISQGWKIYRINYQETNNEKFDDFLKYLKNFDIQPKIMKNEIIKYNKGKLTCLYCGEFFIPKHNKQKFCNQSCSGSYNAIRYSSRKVERPTKEKLEELIKNYPMTTIGKMFGVSDNAVRKWIKVYSKYQTL
jgi:very-short-patch-repair endonuclease